MVIGLNASEILYFLFKFDTKMVKKAIKKQVKSEFYKNKAREEKFEKNMTIIEKIQIKFKYKWEGKTCIQYFCHWSLIKCDFVSKKLCSV